MANISNSKPVSTLHLSWAAGFLEGEGSFRGGKGRTNVVSAAQVQREPLERLQALFGGEIVLRNSHPSAKRRPIWLWSLPANRSVQVMMTLYVLMSPVAAMAQFIASGGGASMTGSAVLDAIVSGVGAFIVTWAVIFLVRLIAAPAALYRETVALSSTGTPLLDQRPLPIVLTLESLASYLRTNARPNRLDSIIAKRGHTEVRGGATIAAGILDDLKKLGIVDIAELDTLLEKREELILYAASQWLFTDGVYRGQCAADLCNIMRAERGKDPHFAKRL